MKQERYSIKDLKKQFPTDDACLEYIFSKRYGKGFTCPKCSKTGFYRVSSRKCYACAWCGYQIHPLAGTIFHKSSTPLTMWFHAIFLFSASRNGVAAKELERQLDVTYKCAFRIAHKIRSLMGDDGQRLSGTVETDDTYIGGHRKGAKGSQGKTIVMGMVKRGGAVKAVRLEERDAYTILNTLKQNVEKGSHLMTDDYSVYPKTKALGYDHDSVNHSIAEYVRDDVYTNTIEGFWSQLKRSINGTYHMVSRKHLQAYVDEFSFRYNKTAVFPALLSRLTA